MGGKRTLGLVALRMTDHTALQFDWHGIFCMAVTDVFGMNASQLNDGSASWDAVAICLGDKAVLITVDDDTDQILVDYAPLPTGGGWQSISSLAFARGQALGWCWVGINSQGYKDSFTVAFAGDEPTALTPRCMFIAEASKLLCFDLVAVQAS
jgi:hypothetical protein